MIIDKEELESVAKELELSAMHKDKSRCCDILVRSFRYLDLVRMDKELYHPLLYLIRGEGEGEQSFDEAKEMLNSLPYIVVEEDNSFREAIYSAFSPFNLISSNIVEGAYTKDDVNYMLSKGSNREAFPYCLLKASVKEVIKESKDLEKISNMRTFLRRLKNLKLKNDSEDVIMYVGDVYDQRLENLGLGPFTSLSTDCRSYKLTPCVRVCVDFNS